MSYMISEATLIARRYVWSKCIKGKHKRCWQSWHREHIFNNEFDFYNNLGGLKWKSLIYCVT